MGMSSNLISIALSKASDISTNGAMMSGGFDIVKYDAMSCVQCWESFNFLESVSHYLAELHHMYSLTKDTYS